MMTEQQIRIIEPAPIACAHCLGSGIVTLTVEEDGEEYEVHVPCRKCVDPRERVDYEEAR